MRSLALVLLRRFLFLPSQQLQSAQMNDTHVSHLTFYDHLSSNSLFSLECLLLYSLEHEPVTAVRQASIETITTLTNYSMQKGHLWPALFAQAVTMVKSQNAILRESAFGIFTGSQIRAMGMQIEDILFLLKSGLEDNESIDVSFWFTVSDHSVYSFVPILSSRSAFLLYVHPKTTF